MIEYEIWYFKKDDKPLIVHVVTTASKVDAMRSFTRQYGIFHWDKWNEEKGTYFTNDACYSVLKSKHFKSLKLDIIQKIREFFYSVKEEVVCVCGSHSTYGIGNGAHSHWCKLHRS